MDRAGDAALRRARARAVARRREPSLEAPLAHPIFDPVRPWLARLDRAGGATLENLNALAEEAQIGTASGHRLRFVAPSGSERSYELRVFESGSVPTRPESRHDLFNALAWLAFPLTKARLNALHAAHIPREGGRRGRFRDLLTLFDEGGAIVRCADAALLDLVRGFRWKELFWERREAVLRAMRFIVIGHAVLEKALQPWPGIACRAILVPPGGDADALAAAMLKELPDEATPRALAPLPVFGYPGWLPGSNNPAFYEDTRYFRAFQRDKPAEPPVKLPAGVGQAAAVRGIMSGAEESPGSAEQDAG